MLPLDAPFRRSTPCQPGNTIAESWDSKKCSKIIIKIHQISNICTGSHFQASCLWCSWGGKGKERLYQIKHKVWTVSFCAAALICNFTSYPVHASVENKEEQQRTIASLLKSPVSPSLHPVRQRGILLHSPVSPLKEYQPRPWTMHSSAALKVSRLKVSYSSPGSSRAPSTSNQLTATE